MSRPGQKRVTPYKITNAQMGLPGGLIGGKLLINDIAARAAGREVAKRATGKFIPGLNIALVVVMMGGIVNEAAGNNGIIITLHEEYVKYFSERE